jgi:hypothetical protein
MSADVTLDIVDKIGLQFLRVVSLGGLIIGGPAWAIAIWSIKPHNPHVGRPVAFLIVWTISSLFFGLMYVLTADEAKCIRS